MNKVSMTKKEYNRYLFISFLLFGLFFALILTAFILENVRASSDISISLMLTGFLFGLAMMVYIFVNYSRASMYEKKSKEKKIDEEACGIIVNFDIDRLKSLLIENRFEEKDGVFYKKKFSLIKDNVRYSVRFYKSSDLETTLLESEKTFDPHIHFTYSQCNIVIISLNRVTEGDIKTLKEFTKKYKIPEEMLAKVAHYNNSVCFLVDKSLGKAYYVKPGRAKITIYAYGARAIKRFYK